MSESLTRVFDSTSDFAEWVTRQAREYNLKLVCDLSNDRECCEELLKSAGKWPVAKLRKVDELSQQHIRSSQEGLEREVNTQISHLRTRLSAAADPLFTLNALSNPGHRQAAMKTLKTCLDSFRADTKLWSKLDSPTKFALRIPARKKAQMAQMQRLFGAEARKVWGDAVEVVFRTMRDGIRDGDQAKAMAKSLSEACKRERSQIIAKAFQSLQMQWRARRGRREMTICLRLQARVVHCDATVEIATATAVEVFSTPTATAAEHLARPGVHLPTAFALDNEEMEEVPSSDESPNASRSSFSEDWDKGRMRLQEASLLPVKSCLGQSAVRSLPYLPFH